MPAPIWQLNFTDDFVRANSSTLGNSWIAGTGNNWTISGNLALMTPVSGNVYAQSVFRDNMVENSLDQKVERVIPANQFTSGDIGIYLRLNRTNKTAYLFKWTPYSNGQAELFIVSNGSTTGNVTISPNWTTAFNSTHTYRAEAYAYGANPTTLRLRVYDDTASGALVYDSGEVTDSTAAMQVSGGTGMTIWNVSAAVGTSLYKSYGGVTTHYEMIGVGDSHVSGTGANPTFNFFAALGTYAGSDWTFVNLAVGGRKVSDMITEAPTNIANYIHRNKKRTLAIVEGLTNDLITETLTATAAFNRLKTLCQLYRSAGAYVLVPTIPPGAGSGFPADFNAQRDAVNALIIAQWSTFSDGLVNMSNDPDIGVSGAEQNLAFFGSDKIHLNDAGHQREYTYYLPAFQLMNTTLDSAPIEAPVITLTLSGGAIQIATNLPRRAQSVTVYKNGAALGTSSAATSYTDSPVLGPTATMPVYTAKGSGLDSANANTATATPFKKSGGGGNSTRNGIGI